jgi:hypothetical protein
MNERILELAEQADEYTDNKIQQQGEYHPDWHDIRDQKFAELIVRECMAKVCKELDNSYSEDGKEILNERVLEHFGVEE